MVKRIIIFSINICLLSSCASKPQKHFEHNLSEGHCEEAIIDLPTKEKSLLEETQTAAGTMASYTLTGLAYGVDVTVFLVGGVVVTAVICSPVIAAEIAAGSSGNVSAQCLGNVVSAPLVKKIIPKELIGKKVYTNTEKWRCPDLTDFSKNLRSVASCNENKNDKLNLEKALVQLDLIKNENFQKNCVDEEEKKMISIQYDNINKKIEKLSSN